MALPAVKARLKRLLGRSLSREQLEKLTEYAIAEREPALSLERAELIEPAGRSWDEVVEAGRRQLWRRTLERMGGEDILLLEFGVWRGDSLREFTRLNPSPNSRFIGFDSFEGLPEDWRGMRAERFDVGGQMPEFDDPRVRLVKGWFNQSLPPMLDEIRQLLKGRELLVHFDSDLYSSTLFLLFTLGERFRRFHFVFDEFSGHETRALFNYIQASAASAEFYYRLDWEHAPQVVSGRLIRS